MGSCRIALLLLLTISGYAQTVNRYFVTFKDKAQTPYTISNPAAFLSAKSIARRARENFATTQEDLPVDSNYVAQVKATGAAVFFSSRWFNGVLVQMDDTMVPNVASLPCVLKVELVAHGKKLLNGRKSLIESGANTATVSNQFQLQQIGLDQMHAMGVRGEGVDVAVFDAGFIGVNTTIPFQHLFAEGRVKDVKNFVKNTADVYTDYDHGTEVLSIMAAYQPDVYEGGAYKANYFLYETEDVYSEFRIEEYNWAFAAERADSAGVDVINSSLGYNTFDDSSMDYSYADMNGKTTVIARAARKAFERGILVVVAAGNEGNNSWQYITTPADAAGVIACGSVDYNGSHSSFSSIGATSDGRIKPDVSALGSGSSIILFNGNTGSSSGTSLSSPLVASLVVGLRQQNSNITTRQIESALLNSSSQSATPDNYLGYGIPNFIQAEQLIKMENDFIVYPNPVNQSFRVFFRKPTDQDPEISVSDVTGKVIKVIGLPVTWSENPLVFYFDETVPGGLYFLRVRTASGSQVIKLIKE